MFFQAIRGAITVESNTAKDILNKTKVLLDTIIDKNQLSTGDIVSITFTATKDLDAQYPAVAARELGMTMIPLMCCQEMHVEGSLEGCIRVLMYIQLPQMRNIQHIYLEKASGLRPDLVCQQGSRDMTSEEKNNLTIAIDGPAGAGKSTVAKLVAQHLDILYLDTGAMYRAIALKMLELQIDPSNPDQVVPMLKSTDIRVDYKNGQQLILLDGADVTNRIRTQEVSKGASDVGTLPEVRLKLVELQRKIASKNSLVMDGRDIGTYVLPNASRKFFLTASIEERAKRRWLELKEDARTESLETIIHEISQRDANDSNRSFAPLKKAEDAILIDTTSKTIQQVVDEICKYINDWVYKR